MQTIRIFISSPSDVGDERQIAGKVIERLQGKYWSFVRLDDVFWEQKVIRSTAHYQDELINPGDCEMIIGILWSRLGSLMPAKFRKTSGERYSSGTEWELEMAFEAYENSLTATGDALTAKPDIVVYRRNQPRPRYEQTDREAEAAEQVQRLDTYFKENYWFPDGTIKRPITNYRTLDDFETLLSRNLEELILRQIPGIKPGFEPPPISGSPFKGLQAFNFADSDRYFGRNREIRDIQQRLITSAGNGLPFVLIYGGSGYGKSSLMRAGLAPALTRPGGSTDDITGWRRVAFQPAKGEGRLCERLMRGLIQPPTPEEAERSRRHAHWPLSGLPEVAGETSRNEAWKGTALTSLLDTDQSRADAVAVIHKTLVSLDRHLLLEVDQLEEIFTIPGIDASDRSSLLQSIGDLCLSGRVWCVATMRSEFFPRVAEEPELFNLVGKDRGYILPPPDRQSLREIIRYPALAARLDFERRISGIEIAGEKASQDFLHDQILADSENSPDALPLLEFTLQQLYEEKRGNLLTWEAYARAGGLKGSIARRATEVYHGLSTVTREARHRIFAALVHLDPARGTITRQRASLSLLKSAPGGEKFVDSFLSAHLLITDDDIRSQEPVVTLAHEALISHWEELSNWIKNHQGDLLARQRLREQTDLWRENGEEKTYLLSEARLAEAQRVADSDLFTLTSGESRFLKLSRARTRRKIRILQVALVIFALVAVAAGGFGWLANEQTKRAEKGETETRRQLALGDMQRAVIKSEQPARSESIAYLARSVRNDPSLLSSGRLLIHRLSKGGYFVPLETRAAIGTPTGVEYRGWIDQDPKGRWTVTQSKAEEYGGPTQIQFEFTEEGGRTSEETYQMPATMNEGPVFSPDLRRFAVAVTRGGEYGYSGEWYVFDRREKGLIASESYGARMPFPIAFSPDGNLLIVNTLGLQLFELGIEGGASLLDEFEIESRNRGLFDGSLVWLPGGASRQFQVGKKIWREVGRPFKIPELTNEESKMIYVEEGSRFIRSNPEELGEIMSSGSEPYAMVRHPTNKTVLLIYREGKSDRMELRNEPWKSNAPIWSFSAQSELEALFHPGGHLLLAKESDSGAGLGRLMVMDPIHGFVLFDFETIGMYLSADGRRVVAEGGEGRPGLNLPLLQAASSVPGWMADLAEGMGGMKLADDGGLTVIPDEKRWKLMRAALASAATSNDAWTEFLHLFITDDDVKPTPPPPLPRDEPAAIPPRFTRETKQPAAEPDLVPLPAPSAVNVQTAVTEMLYTVTGVAIGDALNIRSRPDSTSSFVMSLPNGTSGIRITGSVVMNGSDDWVPVVLGEKSGWTRPKFLAAGPSKKSDSASMTPADRYALGQAYFFGTGRTKDPIVAYSHYRIAADAGLAAAQHKVGVCYAKGYGVPANDEMAVAWYQRAVDQGYHEAEYDLGVRYFQGKGVARDPDRGMELYRRAAAGGYQEAIDAVNRLQK